MKIISWNVNGIRAWSKKENTYDWVFGKQKPDFVCLQEIKATPGQLTSKLLEPEGYYAYFEPSRVKKGYSGVAVYAKHEPDHVDDGLGVKELDQEGRFLALYYDDFVLINCYFPNGGGGDERLQYKLDYYDAFLKYIEKLKKKGMKVVFVGDVNVAHNEIDLARPKENEKNVGFLPIERQWIDKLLEKGWVDTWRKEHPKTVKYSWWDMKTRARDRNVGWRIDYIFVSKDLEKDIQKTDIHNDIYGSDHCPVSLKLK